jgi:hypothetical protein
MDNADYLNQISGGKLGKGVNPRTGGKKLQLPFGLGLNHKTFLILGAVIVVIVGLVAMSAVSQQATMKLRGLAYSIGARAASLDEVVKENHSLIKNSNLRAISGDLQTVLSNFNRDYPAVQGSVQGGMSGTGEAVNTEEAEKAALKSRFASAKMNAILDRSFANEMSYQVGYIALRLEELREQNEQPLLASAYEEFMTTKQRLDNWIDTHQ